MRRSHAPTRATPSLDVVRAQVEDAVRPGNFYVANGLHLEWVKPAAEEISWEIFQGRLLDSAHTRERRSFESWNLYQVEETGRAAEPLLSVKLDAQEMQLHVVRAIDTYAWEGYHAGDNVYLSRETRKWLRELVGSISLRDCSSNELRSELTRLLFEAIVGTSRLPLTSLEAPLPAFSFGRLGYFYRVVAEGEAPPVAPIDTFQQLLNGSLHEKLAAPAVTKLLELLLRSVEAHDVRPATEAFAARWQALGRSRDDLRAVLRSVFNDVALSPWTPFVERVLQFCEALQILGLFEAADRVDFLAFMLRNMARHLTAYDLITFHHRGANYPDALLIDLVLTELFVLAGQHPALFADAPDDTANRNPRLRRRALRQAWTLRRFYKGLPVPEIPTSPGENARVVPVPRVPEEEIVLPGKRTKKLFDNVKAESQLSDPQRAILQQSVRDLDQPLELRELGMAIFLDRPLGIFKLPGEPDRTPLLSYEAFSRAFAENRLRVLRDQCGLLTPQDFERLIGKLQTLQVHGLPLPARKQSVRPDAVSLEDARKAAADFVFLRTTRRTAIEFTRSFDFAPLATRIDVADLFDGQPLLIVGGAVAEGPPGTLVIHDARLQRRLELRIDAEEGYECRAGTELPRGGLRVVRVWTIDKATQHHREQDLCAEDCTLGPIFDS